MDIITKKMKITKNTVVSLAYDLKLVATNELIEEIVENDPLKVLVGCGHLIPAFEQNIEGLEENDTFVFELEASQAFGERKEESFIEISKSAFLVNGEIVKELLVEGQYIPISSADGSQETQGLVIEVKEDSVLMDFNHPLAGQKVVFDGKIVEVRQATKKEIENGFVEGSQADTF